MELNDLYGLDFPSQPQLLPSYELRSKLSHIPTLNNFDIDENYVQSISSKYYDISELSKFHSSKNKNFSLSHVNARSLSKNFDQLLSFSLQLGYLLMCLELLRQKSRLEKHLLPMLIFLSIVCIHSQLNQQQMVLQFMQTISLIILKGMTSVFFMNNLNLFGRK